MGWPVLHLGLKPGSWVVPRVVWQRLWASGASTRLTAGIKGDPQAGIWPTIIMTGCQSLPQGTRPRTRLRADLKLPLDTLGCGSLEAFPVASPRGSQRSSCWAVGAGRGSSLCVGGPRVKDAREELRLSLGYLQLENPRSPSRAGSVVRGAPPLSGQERRC